MERGRLVSIDLDESIGRAAPDVEHDRAVAIVDLIEENLFDLEGHPGGRFRLKLALADRRLVFDVTDEGGQPLAVHILSLTPFRRVIRDYFLICDSYHEAIRTATPSQIEAIDMGRRGIHNDGSDLLRERLKGKIELDKDTARRLFTLICVLHRRT
ncbi:hypothetical protein NS365_09580 [Aureimonas ureilytica]|uniref:UPF0262 protein NS226_19435 n=1 Tax=Aureimonas ureilytica TaxID=401562 RepID=A0A175R3U3_9HYPH|nr:MULTISPECIES: UPF0262 family protein [Aureimonas]KTQ85486.1 hypothetical protein NS226_19435 [Aureimonas ureilytica]KTR06020.1 hypothetical protein NS365_09580 [Aureimonas ureilytica]